MTHNSAQNPGAPADSQTEGQQPRAEGERPASVTHEAQASPQPSSAAGQTPGESASQAGSGSSMLSNPAAAASKAFKGLFGNKGWVRPPSVSTPPSGQGKASPQAAPSAPGVADKIFNGSSYAGPLVLLLIMLAQAWPALLGHNLYCPREAGSVLIFQQSVQNGFWLAPAGAGLAQWPGFFWLLRGLDVLLLNTAPQMGHLLFPLAALFGTLLTLAAVWVFSRVVGMSRQAALAGGMLLLCAPLFAPISSFTGPESLAVALTLFSLSCLCCGWRQNHSFVCLPLGFALAALAGLTGGLFFLLLPVLASVVFLLWRGCFRRAQGLDGLMGFVLLLVLLGCWLAAVILWQQPEGYLKYLGTHLVVWPLPAAGWWKPLLVAGLGLLPWLAIVCCVSWTRVLRTAGEDLAASRKEKAGMAFLWISLALACLLSIPAYGTLGSALCIICLAAPLLGKALLRLSPLGSKLFYIIAALCLLHAGMALVASGFGFSLEWLGKFFHFSLDEQQRAAVLSLKALPVLGGICIAAAILLARLVRRGAHGGTSGALILCTCIAVILAQPATLMLAPQLERVPYAQAKSLNDILAPAEPVAAPATEPEEAAPAPATAEPPAQEIAPAAPAVVPNAPAATQEKKPAAPEAVQTEQEKTAQSPADGAATTPEAPQAPAAATPAESAPKQKEPQTAPAEAAPRQMPEAQPQGIAPEAAPAAPAEEKPAN